MAGQAFTSRKYHETSKRALATPCVEVIGYG
jgi:hypothetical protein